MRLRTKNPIPISALITDALYKDLGPKGDITTHSIVRPDIWARAKCFSNESGVVSGIKVAQLVFKIGDPKITVNAYQNDGELVKRNDIVLEVIGPAQSILSRERVALEFLRRMSGIATKTREFVGAVAGTGVTILDTRKTFPGYGELDKQAVRDGGGTNHRMNLSEMGLIKNNHIDLIGGDITKAIQLFRKAYPKVFLEVEVRTKKELAEALSQHPDRILLDNMTDIQLRKAVKTRNEYAAKTHKKVQLEASGAMTLLRVREVSRIGVEYISVGELTHTVKPLDLSLHIQHST